MTNEFETTFEALVAGWNATADANRASVGQGWEVAEVFARLHFRALKAISRSAGAHPDDTHTAGLLAGTHSLNLLLGIVDLVMRGQHDVAGHLLRGVMDAQSLLFAVLADPTDASEYLGRGIKASDARMKIVQTLRGAGAHAEADDVNDRFLTEYGAANTLAHAGAVHAEKVLERSDGSITPIVGGRADARESVLMLAAALDQEFWALTWFAQFQRPSLDEYDEPWSDDFERARTQFAEWRALPDEVR